MKNNNKNLLIFTILLSIHDLNAVTKAVAPKETTTKGTLQIGAQLHKIIPHTPIVKPQPGKSLQQLRDESSKTIKQMTLGLTGVQKLEVTYKGLLSINKDARQTLSEFKQILTTSIASLTTLIEGIDGHVSKLHEIISKLDADSQKLFADL